MENKQKKGNRKTLCKWLKNSSIVLSIKMVTLENLAVFTVEIINEKKKGLVKLLTHFQKYNQPKAQLCPKACWDDSIQPMLNARHSGPLVGKHKSHSHQSTLLVLNFIHMHQWQNQWYWYILFYSSKAMTIRCYVTLDIDHIIEPNGYYLCSWLFTTSTMICLIKNM